MNGLKVFKPFKKRNKKPKQNKTNRDIRFSKGKIRRNVSLLIFTVIFLSLAFNLIFFTKYQTIRNTVKAKEQAIDQQLNKVIDEEEDIYNSHSVVVFTQDFLRTYYNIPRDQEERNKRSDELTQYFVSGFPVSRLESLDDFTGERKATQMQFVEMNRVDDKKVNMHFLVNYDITEFHIEVEEVEEEKEVEDKDGKKKKKKVTTTVETEVSRVTHDFVEMVVPIITDGSGFAVTHNPNIINRDLKAVIQLKQEDVKGEEVSSTESKQITDFLADFFTSYGLSDEKLPFMANVEKGLTDKVYANMGIRQLKSDGDVYHIIADVEYQNKETSFNSLYTYYLVATKDRTTYYIEDIKQGGF